jgi:YVTN family beta-propeller protein
MRKLLPILFLFLFLLPCSANPKAVRVLLWSEGTEPLDVYPHGINGTLANALGKSKEFRAKVATLSDPEWGLSESDLADTDVIIWFGHRRHKEVPDHIVDRVVRHVKERGVGFIALHSAHFAKPLQKLLNDTGSWTSYVNQGKRERMWIVLPDHPIAQGIKDFEIPQDEIYTEPFKVPEPSAVIIEGTWDSGHRNREVMTWDVGKGRVVYIRAGHETYPIYHMPVMQRLIGNAVKWTAGVVEAPANLVKREAGPAATVTGPHPSHREPDADSFIVVLNKREDTIDILSGRTTERLGRISTGIHPHEVIVSRDGTRAYASIFGDGSYGRNPTPNNRIVVVDIKQKRSEEIDVSPYKAPHGLAVDADDQLWVTCENDSSVLVIDPVSKKITSVIPTGTKGTHWVHILNNSSKAYTSNKEYPKISVIDVKTRKITGEIPVPRGVEGIGSSPDSKRLYAADYRENLLWVIDTGKDQVVKEVSLKNKPGRVIVTKDNRLVLISNYQAGTVEVVDTKSLTSKKLIQVGKSPMTITLSTDGKLAFVSNSGEKTVSVIDLKKLSVLRNVLVGDGPDGIVYTQPRSLFEKTVQN